MKLFLLKKLLLISKWLQKQGVTAFLYLQKGIINIKVIKIRIGL
jgi:hypothetical protein